jgi:GNAT superfamily N-acetyltransferase
VQLPKGTTLATLSELTIEQLEQVAGLHLRAPTSWGNPDYDEEGLRARMATGWHAKVATGDEYILAAVTEGTVCAFVWAAVRARPARHVFIHSLWVDADLRRRGIARGLKERLEAWAREQGAGWVETTVHSRNAGMLELNAQMGYVDTYRTQRKNLESGS